MHRLPRTIVAALLALLPGLLPMHAAAHPIPVPDVPADIVVESGHRPFLVGHARGTQNYICLPSAQATSGFAWTLFGPQATLFDERDRQITTHFLSPNPDEGGTPRATWHHSDDSSSIWALRTGGSTDPAYVDTDAIAWLRLRVTGNEDGPTRGDKLSDATFIQRINTVGGKSPETGCESAKVGASLLIPYEADYVFYKAVRRP